MDWNKNLKDGERLDDLNRDGLKIIQNTKSFCFGIDAVLLTDFAKVHTGEVLLDLGTGTGIIPILLSAKTKGSHFTGLEIQSESVDMARRSVELNQLSHKVSILEGDLKRIQEQISPASMNVVTANPPYMNTGGGLINVSDKKALARHEILCTLSDVIQAAAYALIPQGRFYLVHRPQRLADIFEILRAKGLEPKVLQQVQYRIDKEPSLVLIEATKNGKKMLKVLPPVILSCCQ